MKRFFENHPAFPRNKRGEVTQQRVVEILTQPLYTGYICSETYGLHWLKGHHAALISMETFERVQARRARPAKAPLRKNIGDDFALRGMVACAGCAVPLRSSWAKGRSGAYAYYLCQTKSCAHYGKSIPRDKIEGEVGDLIKSLQPTKPLMQLARAMFAAAWDQRRAQAAEIVRAGQRQLAIVEKQVDALLTRIVDATNPMVIKSYEGKLAELERERAILNDQMAKQTEPKVPFEEQLEPVLTFLANPWKLWQSGQVTLRRTVLRLAFSERITYCRFEGARTAERA